MSKSDYITKVRVIKLFKKLFNVQYIDVEQDKTPDLVLKGNNQKGIEITLITSEEKCKAESLFLKLKTTEDSEEKNIIKEKLKQMGYVYENGIFAKVRHISREFKEELGMKNDYVLQIEDLKDFIAKAEIAVERKLNKNYSNCKETDLLLFDTNSTLGFYKEELFETLKKYRNKFNIIYVLIYPFHLYICDYINNDVNCIDVEMIAKENEKFLNLKEEIK